MVLAVLTACLLALGIVADARAAAFRQAPLIGGAAARATQGGPGQASLAEVSSNPEMRMSLERDALGYYKQFTTLAHLIIAGAYVAGIGLGIASVVKFKQHKDNPTQIALGRPVQFLFVGATLQSLDSFLAMAGAQVFKQDREDGAIAASEKNQANADPPEGQLARVAASDRAFSAPVGDLEKDVRLAALFAVENREFLDEEGLVEVAQAEIAALDRSAAALRAGDHVAYEKHKAGVARYLGDEATLLTDVVALRHNVADAFRALNIGVHISHAGMVKLARYITSHGLSGVRRGIERWGVTPASIGLAAASSSQLASQFSAPGSGFDLASLFNDPAQQDHADRHLARLLQASANQAEQPRAPATASGVDR